jgi:hypothetical protein
VNADLANKRHALLTEFLAFLTEWMQLPMDGNWESEHRHQEIQSIVHRKAVAARDAVEAVGVGTVMTIGAPPAAGGGVSRVDMFGAVFRSFYGELLTPHVVAVVEQALGVYDSLMAGDGLVRSHRAGHQRGHRDEPAEHVDPGDVPGDDRQRVDQRLRDGPSEPRAKAQEATDIEAAINRALRVSFPERPSNEREVQDRIETILASIGVDYRREKDRTAIGPTTFIPDFTIESLGMALEVKVARTGQGAAEIQRQIAQDVTAYGTKWPHRIFVVYDCDGMIQDPMQFERDNKKHFNVRVVVVKH